MFSSSWKDNHTLFLVLADCLLNKRGTRILCSFFRMNMKFNYYVKFVTLYLTTLGHAERQHISMRDTTFDIFQ